MSKDFQAIHLRVELLGGRARALSVLSDNVEILSKMTIPIFSPNKSVRISTVPYTRQHLVGSEFLSFTCLMSMKRYPTVLNLHSSIYL